MKKITKLFFIALLFIVSLITIAACVTDKPYIIPVESISIIGADNTLINVQEQYTAVIAPDNATSKTVTWEIESGTAEISDNGILLSTEIGTIIIKATADGKSTTKQITVTTPKPSDEPTDPLNATFSGFEIINDTTFKIKVSNTTENLNIAEIATISSDWKLTTDMQALNEIPSKIATPLNIGDNEFYVLVSHKNNVRLYTLKIRRKPIYKVTFNTNGGDLINAQFVEEDSFISVPNEPAKSGYKFVSWDKNIAEPITADTIFNSIWQAHTYTITYISNCETSTSQTQEVIFNKKVTLKDINEIKESAFWLCTNLKRIYCYESIRGAIIGAYNTEYYTAIKYYFWNSPIYDGQHWHYDTDNTTPIVWQE